MEISRIIDRRVVKSPEDIKGGAWYFIAGIDSDGKGTPFIGVPFVVLGKPKGGRIRVRDKFGIRRITLSSLGLKEDNITSCNVMLLFKPEPYNTLRGIQQGDPVALQTMIRNTLLEQGRPTDLDLFGTPRFTGNISTTWR